jgi:transcriptional regulator with XRE-family HTH domain
MPGLVEGIGERLRTVLTELGLTQARLAEHLGVPTSVVKAWLRAKKPTAPDVAQLNALAQGLDINLNYLVSGRGPIRLDQAEGPAASETELLHAHVLRAIRLETECEPAGLKRLLPPPGEFLQDVVRGVAAALKDAQGMRVERAVLIARLRREAAAGIEAKQSGEEGPQGHEDAPGTR